MNTEKVSSVELAHRYDIKENRGAGGRWIVFCDGEMQDSGKGLIVIGDDPRREKITEGYSACGWSGVQQAADPIVPHDKMEQWAPTHRFPQRWKGAWTFAEVATKEQAFEIREAIRMELAE